MSGLAAGLGLVLTGRLMAQTFTNLHSFTTLSAFPYTNSDGASPVAGLVLSGNTLYGTAKQGGRSGYGTVFALHSDGTGAFTNLHSFTAPTGSLFSNRDGATPYAGLILSGNTLYGTAEQGGNSGYGTVFRVNTAGTDFTNLYSFTFTVFDSSSGGIFTNGDGATPVAGLVLSGNTLYGTAEVGGSSGNGTVFAVHPDGTGGFTNLHNFTATSGSFPGPYTNSDGAGPVAGLILSGNTLYGTAENGGSSGSGAIFAVRSDGTGGFTNLYSFTALSKYFNINTNTDGANPLAGLVLSNNTLYGTARNGGSSGKGTVFAVHTDGTGFTNLHNFAGYISAVDPFDGAIPEAGLILSGDTLYGTAVGGGSSDDGTVFALKTNGTDYRTLYSFTATSGPLFTNSDGASPTGLILSGNTLFGTASAGGTFGGGTVFSLTLPPPPQLTITRSGTNVIVTWPANFNGFTLEFATNLVPPAVWNTNLPVPVAVNGQFTVTNPISGSQKFYRLTQ
jgi:uncharacterized repeat protein (TIGR03803 family)